MSPCLFFFSMTLHSAHCRAIASFDFSVEHTREALQRLAADRELAA
jgi:hypothetical protein